MLFGHLLSSAVHHIHPKLLSFRLSNAIPYVRPIVIFIHLLVPAQSLFSFEALLLVHFLVF